MHDDDLSELDASTDPADILASVQRDSDRVAAAIGPDPRLIYAAWGTAWLVGYLLMFAAHDADAPVTVAPLVAGLAFFVLLVGAMAVTGVHMARRFAGVRGVSARTGGMYGWAWALSLVAFFAIATGIRRSGATDEVMNVVWSSGSTLVVAVLYLAGGAFWQDRVQYGLGAWILLTSAASALVGSPGLYLVMGLGGGGGFLLAAAWFAVRRAPDRPAR